MKKKNMHDIIIVSFFIKTILVVSMIASIQAFKVRARPEKNNKAKTSLYDRTYYKQELEKICSVTRQSVTAEGKKRKLRCVL